MIGLKYIRTIKGKSLSEVAEELKISNQAVSAWENGKKDIPAKRLQQLSEIFGIPQIYFQKELTDIDCSEIQAVVQSDEISDSDMLAIQEFLLAEYEVLERILDTEDIAEFKERFLTNPNVLKVFVNKSKMESQIFIRNLSVKVINLSQQDQYSFDQIKELSLMSKLLQSLYLVSCEMPSEYISKSIKALENIIGGNDANDL